jgi:tripartite-type tricarboxylate transporter receptor subunit TctC
MHRGLEARHRIVMLQVAVVLVLTCGWPQPCLTLDYPSKPITIIVPFAAGGAIDTQARLLAKGLADRAGRPVVVENRTGAAGAIGTTLAARAAPDGHTFLLGALYLAVEPVLRGNVGYEPLRDFAPVTLVTQAPFILAVSSASPFKNLGELLAHARQHQGIAFGTPGPGTAPHLLGEMLKAAAHVDLVHVSYKGEAPAIVDLVGGQIQIAFVSPFAGLPQFRGGKLRPLVVSGRSRLPVLRDVPTFAEAGFPGFDLEFWCGVLVPARTPREVVARLHTLVVSVLESSEFVQAVESSGGLVIPSSPQEFVQRLQADSASVSRLAKQANVKIEE